VLSGSSGSSSIQLDPRSSEDCLLLEVVVPKPVLDNTEGNGGKAPVLGKFYLARYFDT
jgi:carboxylesterase type B